MSSEFEQLHRDIEQFLRNTKKTTQQDLSNQLNTINKIQGKLNNAIVKLKGETSSL